MKTIKFLLLLSLSFFSSSIFGMQKSLNITIEETPQFLNPDQKYKIRAFRDGVEVGYITYKNKPKDLNPHIWEMEEFYMEEDFRKNKAGTQLFIKCIQHLKQLNANVLFWIVHPMTTAMTFTELNLIYKKIITKAGYPESSLKEQWATKNGKTKKKMYLTL